MAHAKDDHNKADAYHHMAGKEKKAHEGSQSSIPDKSQQEVGGGNFGPTNDDQAY